MMCPYIFYIAFILVKPSLPNCIDFIVGHLARVKYLQPRSPMELPPSIDIDTQINNCQLSPFIVGQKQYSLCINSIKALHQLLCTYIQSDEFGPITNYHLFNTFRCDSITIYLANNKLIFKHQMLFQLALHKYYSPSSAIRFPPILYKYTNIEGYHFVPIKTHYDLHSLCAQFLVIFLSLLFTDLDMSNIPSLQRNRSVYYFMDWRWQILHQILQQLLQLIIPSNMIEVSDSEDLREMQPVYDDDLADYEDQIQEQICKQVMGMVEDDAQQLQRSNSEQAVSTKKQLTQAQRQARQLKIKNARKYFQVVKLTYIKQVSEGLKQANYISHKYNIIVCQYLSILSLELIEEYQRLRKIQPLSIKIDEIVVFLKKAKEYINSQTIQLKYNQAIIFWSFCESFKLACRKIRFFDLESLVQETFYKLNYFHIEKALKKQAKRAKEYQLMKIQIDLKKQEQQQKQGHDYLHFQDFQFDANSFQKSRQSNSNKNKPNRQSTSQPIVQKQTEDKYGLKARRENNFMRKRNYKWAYFHIYSSYQQKWKLINSQILEFQQQSQCKSYLLSSKPIIGFYSYRLLHFQKEYEPLQNLRLFKKVVLEDTTMYFFDNMKHLTMRRKRVGVKYIMKDLFQKGSFNKNRFMLTSYDQYVMNKNDSIQLQFQLTNFPKSKQEMLNSQYFITPSLSPQYCILDPKAVPVQKQFNEQKVYLRRDLIPATSKMVWVDRGRKVKQNEVAVKKTENKSKNMTELFLYEQTEPYYLSIDEQSGNFIADDQYNSIYVPPDYLFDQKFAVITKSISGICNKHNFRHVRLVQGFTHTMGKILPNYIGYLVYKQDEQKIMEFWEQKQKLHLENKQKNREKYLVSLWSKLFTKIELSQWSNNFVK